MQKLELFVKTASGKALSIGDLELQAQKGAVSRQVLEEKTKAYQELKVWTDDRALLAAEMEDTMTRKGREGERACACVRVCVCV